MSRQPDMLPFSLTLRTGSEELRLTGSVPDAPMTLDELLPMLQQLDDLVVDAAEREAAEHGAPVTCGPGCGACCRQLVPISETEASALAALVYRMKPTQRAEVRRRFADALARLRDAGVLERIEALSATASLDELHELGIAYFEVGVACPFLVAESCSIHAERPLVCREFLVTTPPARCADPAHASTARLAIPAKVSGFLHTFAEDPAAPAALIRWVPLVGALQWAATRRPRPKRFPSRLLVERLVEHLGEAERRSSQHS